jgi:hypothetical protein
MSTAFGANLHNGRCLVGRPSLGARRVLHCAAEDQRRIEHAKPNADSPWPAENIRFSPAVVSAQGQHHNRGYWF